MLCNMLQAMLLCCHCGANHEACHPKMGGSRTQASTRGDEPTSQTPVGHSLSQDVCHFVPIAACAQPGVTQGSKSNPRPNRGPRGPQNGGEQRSQSRATPKRPEPKQKYNPMGARGTPGLRTGSRESPQGTSDHKKIISGVQVPCGSKPG